MATAWYTIREVGMDDSDDGPDELLEQFHAAGLLLPEELVERERKHDWARLRQSMMPQFGQQQFGRQLLPHQQQMQNIFHESRLLGQTRGPGSILGGLLGAFGGKE